MTAFKRPIRSSGRSVDNTRLKRDEKKAPLSACISILPAASVSLRVASRSEILSNEKAARRSRYIALKYRTLFGRRIIRVTKNGNERVEFHGLLSASRSPPSLWRNSPISSFLREKRLRFGEIRETQQCRNGDYPCAILASSNYFH